MGENDKKKLRAIKMSVLIASIFVILLSVTYAFINVRLTGTKKQVITAGNLDLELKEDENNLTITNALPMYDEVGMLQNPFTFRLINKTSTNTNYILKLVDITTGEKLDTSIVKYGFTKDGVSKIDLVSNIKDGQVDKGVIGGNQTIEYTLRLWISSGVEDDTLIKNKSLSYRIDVEVTQDIPKDSNSSEVKLFASENLGTNCKTYDDGVDTFLVGQCQNNYVWYSGKLWRVVLKNNETLAVKLVTDNAITAIPYNSSNRTNFENSYVDQWLQQEFLPTLHDYQDYLVVNSKWDATLNSSSTPERPNGTTIVERTVGLLNSYEYYTTYGHSDGLAASSTNYLRNGFYWCTLTPYSTSSVHSVYSNGNLSGYSPTNGVGARPSVNLQSNIQITAGNGSISEPYRLAGDEQEIINGTTLLSTRYSGEYVNFNNQKYRIVAVEDGLTKIIAVDKPSELASSQFHSDSSVTSFANASIRTDLQAYYENNIAESYKSMIAENQTWYLGTVGSGKSYKASVCATFDTKINTKTCTKTTSITQETIGLPRVGEMFTSQITRETKDFFWTLTPYNTTIVWIVDSRLSDYFPTTGVGARPSAYLKSNIRIASTNTGDGTYEHPYDIELGG